MKRKHAFTLVEVMCVLLLIGLLSGTAVLALSRPLRIARARQAVAEISAFDASARQAAQRSGRQVYLVVDSFERKLLRRHGADQGNTAVLDLADGLRIEQIRTRDGHVGDSKLQVRCSAQGISRSYALRLVGEGFDQWLLVAGLSGQITVANNESEVEKVLATSARGDAD